MKWLQAVSILTLIPATVFLGYVPSQSDFSLIIIGGAIAFIAYGYLSFFNRPSIKIIFITGICIRILLLFAFPNLSDDIYRFVWDGQLISQGINPYGHLPSDLMSQNVSGLSETFYTQMNSPDYYTIYPPLTQLIFYISTWFSQDVFRMSLCDKAGFFDC